MDNPLHPEGGDRDVIELAQVKATSRTDYNM
jgi:hypothetical protein